MRRIFAGSAKKNEESGAAIRQVETFLGRIEVSVPGNIEDALFFEQRLWDPVLLSQVMLACAKSSFRDAEDISNGLLRREGTDVFSYRTFQETVRREGKQAENEMERMTKNELRMYGIDPETGKPMDGVALSETLTNPRISPEDRNIMAQRMEEAIAKYNESTDEPEEQVCWEAIAESVESIPDSTVVLCVDEVGVHQQKKTRSKESSAGYSTGSQKKKDARIGRHYEETTVVYLRAREGTYRFAAGNVLSAVLMALGYMLHWNMLQDRDLMIFSDGAVNIRKVIESVFAFRPYTLNLDWFHLRKHCYEVFTMALVGGIKNRARNDEIRYHFDKRLFAGNVEGAKQYLDALDPGVIRNRAKIDELKKYLEAKEYGIYPYAIRKNMGIINSSNQGEKSNDLVVAQRCKHNGMSWTGSGINGMRNINLIILNNEPAWYESHVLEYKPVPLSAKIKEQYQRTA